MDSATNLRDRTLSGLAWSGVGQVVVQVIQFVFSIILARLLSPQEFGLVSMVAVFTSFIELFRTFGLGSALVQRTDLDERHLNSVFWSTLCAGVLCTAIAILASPLVAGFYTTPLLRPLTIVMALNFGLSSLCIVPEALLLRDLDLRRIFRIETTVAIGSGAIGITLASVGMGVWSLVFQSIIARATSVILMWRATAWQPKVTFDLDSLRELLPFGTGLLGFSIINYWVRSFDKLLIGKVFGAESLGIYARAYGLMLLPISQVSGLVGRVMFPALSAIQGDNQRVKRIYLRATRMIALVTFPLMVGVFVVAESLILVIYGEQWRAVIPLLQVLCVAGLTQGVGTTVGWIYTSQGRTGLMFKWGIFAGVVYISSFLIGLHWGVFGIALAYVLAGYGILWYPSWRIAGSLINLKFAEMVRNVAGSFWCAITMGITVWSLRFLFPAGWPHSVILGAQVFFGIMIYVVLIHCSGIDAYRELRALVSEWVDEPRDAATVSVMG